MDLGAAYTDQEMKKLARQIDSIYKEAREDIDRKMKDFNERYKVKEAKYQKMVNEGKMSQKAFDNWKKGQVFQGKQWQAKKQDIENVLHNSNVLASNIVNSKQIDVFGFNLNYASYSMEHDAAINFGFNLYDKETVINLLRNEPNLLPNYVPKAGLDNAWNSKKITRQITLGIIQGEKLDQIADRLAKATSSQNRNSMLTHARTLMTGAQNAGRLNSYEKAQKLGIDLEKEWMATLDGHTRDSHADIDGEKQPVDHRFSNECMYPGDPGGPPAEVYNCRCTMVSDIKKYPSIYNRYDNESRERIRNMSYRDWEKAKKTGGNLKPYSIDKIKIGDLFQGLSQNGAYTAIHDVDVKLSNQFYKELQEMGKYYIGGAKPAQVWNDYLNDNLPSGVSSAKLEKIMGQYKDKAQIKKASSGEISASFKATKINKATNSIPVPKDAVKSQFKTTEDWLDAAKKNPDIDGMLELEKNSFKKFTNGEAEALRIYSGSAYSEMNNYLRYKAIGLSDSEAAAKSGIRSSLIAEVEKCQSALSKSKLEQDLVLRRGTDVGDLAGLFMKGDFGDNYRKLSMKSAEELNEMFQGAMGEYAGFTSTSSQWNKGFSGDVECVIYAPKGTPAASIMGISNYGTAEGETLLNAGTKVICEKIEKSDGHKGSDIRVFLRIIS